ncbi:phosphotransferase [Candidatus Woesearchaeota archaeon]|nr:phosphotransferase [Candidatus Woesearchaeota archaeon]
MKDKIVSYIKSLDLSIFGQNNSPITSIKINKVIERNYSLNYYLVVNGTKCILKLNINNMFNIDSMLSVEYSILKYMNGVFGPKVYHLDTSRKAFPFDILICEYIDGDTPKEYNKQVLINIAKVMSVIHSIDTEQMKTFLPTRTPFENFELFTAFQKDIKKTKELAVINQLIAKAKHELYNNKSLFTNVNQCFIYYGLDLDDLLFKENKIKLIDWSLSCKGDKAEDIAFVFSVANLFHQKPLNQKTRNLFLEQFTLYGDDRTLAKRLKLFEFLTSLYILCILYRQLYSSTTPKEILKKHKKKYESCLKYGVAYLKKMK